ncbi:MAG: YraN family protein [Acidobacteriota bacterium]|nr:YraN family protein [Acidobacteriota bacterium]
MKSAEGEDWKKRLKALGIVRKRKPKKHLFGKKEKDKDLRKVKSGRLGEDAACALFEENSLVVLARNVRYPDGEIDIVALDGSVVVFAEVKWRRNDALGTPAESVTLRKRSRVIRAARRWLAAHPSRSRSVRFDVVAIRHEPHEVLWIRGAFDAGR